MIFPNKFLTNKFKLKMANAGNNCINYNCAEPPPYDSTLANCSSAVRGGGANVLFLLHCGTVINDPGDEAELNAAVLAGNATRVENIKLGFGVPAPVEIDPTTSCGSKKVSTYDRTADIEDFKVNVTNSDFWDTVKDIVYEGFVVIECETKGLTQHTLFVDAEVSVRAYENFPNTVATPQNYVAQLLWRSLANPKRTEFTAA